MKCQFNCVLFMHIEILASTPTFAEHFAAYVRKSVHIVEFFTGETKIIK